MNIKFDLEVSTLQTSSAEVYFNKLKKELIKDHSSSMKIEEEKKDTRTIFHVEIKGVEPFLEFYIKREIEGFTS